MNQTITIRNDLSELEPLRRDLAGFLSPQGVTEETVDEVFLIAEEVVVNTISYGYDDEAEHTIEIRLSLEDRLLRLEFRDDGRTYNPLEREDPDLDLPMSERPIGGLGVHIVKTLAEDVAYERKGGQNVLTVEKRV
jgi:anti-sigma regulatory factor (Ser/Thr protein kinase)